MKKKQTNDSEAKPPRRSAPARYQTYCAVDRDAVGRGDAEERELESASQWQAAIAKADREFLGALQERARRNDPAVIRERHEAFVATSGLDQVLRAERLIEKASVSPRGLAGLGNEYEQLKSCLAALPNGAGTDLLREVTALHDLKPTQAPAEKPSISLEDDDDEPLTLTPDMRFAQLAGGIQALLQALHKQEQMDYDDPAQLKASRDRIFVPHGEHEVPVERIHLR